jgi:hypothetical protein
MVVTLESSTKIVELKTPEGVVPARIWEGTTASGIKVHAFITRIAVVKSNDDTSEFERELRKCRPPSADIAALPMRMVL